METFLPLAPDEEDRLRTLANGDERRWRGGTFWRDDVLRLLATLDDARAMHALDNRSAERKLADLEKTNRVLVGALEALTRKVVN